MALDKERFKETLVYAREGTVAAVEADVAVLRNLDKEFEALEKTWGDHTTLALLVTLGAGALGCLFPPLLAVAAVALVVMIVCAVKKSGYGKLNTEDRRYELLAGALRLLETDMAPDAQVAVKLDLNRPNVGSKQVDKGRVGTWSVVYYEDPWLHVQGRLLDGTSFKLSATERYQDRSKRKVNPRGKVKHKSKTKSATVFSLALKVKGKRYAHLDELGPRAREALELDFGSSKQLSVQEGGLLLKVQSKTPWDATPPGQAEPERSGTRLVAMMFLSLYQVLNLSRVMTKKDAA